MFEEESGKFNDGHDIRVVNSNLFDEFTTPTCIASNELFPHYIPHYRLNNEEESQLIRDSDFSDQDSRNHLCDGTLF